MNAFVNVDAGVAYLRKYIFDTVTSVSFYARAASPPPHVYRLMSSLTSS